MRKSPQIPRCFRDGEWFRRDGRPVRLSIGGGGSYLECQLTKRREPVDALILTTLFICRRLVRHDPHPPVRRSRRTTTGGGREEA